MRKYLLPKEGNFYKANLHVHTTFSDGQMTAEEVKKAYMAKGYSIVAYTDHEIMIPHNELSDENFLAITSTEIVVDEDLNCDGCFKKTYHLNLYSKEKTRSSFSSFTDRIIWFHHSDKYITEEQRKINYDRRYSVECVNEMIQMAKKENCLVSYNHPFWSMQDYSDYISLKGLWGVEWLNGACDRNGYYDSFNPIDNLLRRGERVFPLASDDSHNIGDCFRGFVMVKSKDLTYENVYKALGNGDFYSSSRPLIFDLYIEDGIVYIKTSKARQIFVSTERRYTKNISADNELIEEASLDINDYINMCNNSPKGNCYIRITVVDENGYKAHTRAYFIDEFI